MRDAELDEYLGSGYGIFAGRKVEWATLKFTPEAARWVSAQNWHPKQRARVEKDGGYVLELPYAEDRELVMEILKFGADVEVLAPPALRQRVADALRRGASATAIRGRSPVHASVTANRLEDRSVPADEG